MNYERRHDVEVPDDLDAWTLAEHAEKLLRQQLDGRLFITAKNDRGEAEGVTVSEVRSDLKDRTHTTTRIYMAIRSADTLSHDTVVVARRTVDQPWKCSVLAEGPDLTRVKGSASVLEDGVVDWVGASKHVAEKGRRASQTRGSFGDSFSTALPAKPSWWRVVINNPWVVGIGTGLLLLLVAAIFF